MLNTTPGNDGNSPAYKMYHPNLRTTFPTGAVPPFNLISKVKDAYDQHARNLKSFKPGTTVRIRTDKQQSWSQKGRAVQKCRELRTYIVLNEKGNMVRRNRRHLLPTQEPFKVAGNYDDPHISPAHDGNNSSTPSTTSKYGRAIRVTSRYADFNMS